MIFKYAVPAIMDSSWLWLAESFGNSDLQTKASLAFTEVAILPSRTRKAEVVLN